MRHLLTVIAGLLVAGIASSASARAQAQGANALTAGEFLVEPATLINLGFEWFIEGDANRTASVEVSFQKTGTSAWRAGLPLLRLNRERIRQGAQLDVTVPNMFAGSILDLEPDTSYEAQFILKDADGVHGEARKTVTVRTRAEPKPATDGKTYHVYLHDHRRPHGSARDLRARAQRAAAA
jgi:hypothetical protein